MNHVMRNTNPASELLTRLRQVLPQEKGPYQLHEPELTEAERALVMQALDEGFVSYAGRHVALFEAELARYCDTTDAVAMVSGTAAIHALLYALGIGPGDEVLCPALTFVATANAISHTGAVPHFVDCSPANLGINVERLSRHLETVAEKNAGGVRNKLTGRRIAAIMPVHIFGHIGDMDALNGLAAEWGLVVLEDGTEALGSTDNKRRIGHNCLAATLSFNGNKIVTTGGGGAVVTNDRKLARRLKHITTTAKLPHAWRFEHDEIGFNYRMPNLNAALGVAQMSRLDDMLARKRALTRVYRRAFMDASHWRFLDQEAGKDGNFWLNAVLLQEPAADLLEEALGAAHQAGYHCRPAWTPMHKLEIYEGAPRADLSITEDLAARILCLPSSPQLMAVACSG